MTSIWVELAAFIAYTIAIAYGAHYIDSEFYDDANQKREVAVQQAVIVADTKTNQIDQGVSNDLQKRLTDIDRSYSDGVLVATPTNGVQIPGGSTVGYASSCSNGFSQRAQDGLKALSKQADINTARLIACQEWIKEQSN